MYSYGTSFISKEMSEEYRKRFAAQQFWNQMVLGVPLTTLVSLSALGVALLVYRNAERR